MKLTYKQHTFLNQLIDLHSTTTYDSGYIRNLKTIVREGEYDNLQKYTLNKVIIPKYLVWKAEWVRVEGLPLGFL
jgi:hypothetical protein